MVIFIIIDLKKTSAFATDLVYNRTYFFNFFDTFKMFDIFKKTRAERGNSHERHEDRGLSLEIQQKCDADAISANILATKLSDFEKSPRSAASHKLPESLSDVNTPDWSDSMESMQLRHQRSKKDGELTLIK